MAGVKVLQNRGLLLENGPLYTNLYVALHISKTDWDGLRRHAELAYPDECCGVLVGHIHDGETRVDMLIRCQNAHAGSSRTHYEIAPAELFRIQRDCRHRGNDIVGFYHSHPDHPAHWSATDLAEAHWTGCSYVITSVERGTARDTRSFRLAGSEADKHFTEEQIEVT